jgi:hypothetical protein
VLHAHMDALLDLPVSNLRKQTHTRQAGFPASIRRPSPKCARQCRAAPPPRAVLLSSTPSARLVTFQITPVRPW